ncbi:SDR family NAD(P)-dependent oxidoreductase [Bordetella sp. 2513F-2]
MSLQGKKVLITGAAGGLGTGVTWAFARAGAEVWALDRDAAGAGRLAGHGDAAEARARIHYVQADLARSQALRAQLDALFAGSGGVDVLVNNAAIYPSKAVADYTLDEYREVQSVNADAALVCVQAALPYMRARAWGRIINVTSVTLSGGWPNLLPYVASKGALLGMTRALARELGPDGITVNCISPGAFPTDAEKIHPDPEGYQRHVLERQAVKRRGTPEDIAQAMLFFASPASGFITGQTLNVDGGWWMQ